MLLLAISNCSALCSSATLRRLVRCILGLWALCGGEPPAAAESTGLLADLCVPSSVLEDDKGFMTLFGEAGPLMLELGLMILVACGRMYTIDPGLVGSGEIMGDERCDLGEVEGCDLGEAGEYPPPGTSSTSTASTPRLPGGLVAAPSGGATSAAASP